MERSKLSFLAKSRWLAAFCFIATLSSTSQAIAQTDMPCYVNKGLRDEERIEFIRNGAAISGEWLIDRDYDTGKRERHPFTGMQQGNRISITFSGGAPDSMPPKQTQHTLTVQPTALLVERYGRNHVTGAWGIYTATYLPCAANTGSHTRTPQRVHFARGASSATLPVEFTAQSERKSFVLNLGKGQQVTVDAPGCAITVYTPDRKRQDDTVIDRLTLPALPSSGDYIFVVSPAGTPGRRSVSFSAR